MSLEELFRVQISKGATVCFYYAVEYEDSKRVYIFRHTGPLSTFPSDLNYIRHLNDKIPMFKKKLFWTQG